jgi:hypothetical protein
MVCHIVCDTHDSYFQNCKHCVANTKQGIGHHHTFWLFLFSSYTEGIMKPTQCSPKTEKLWYSLLLVHFIILYFFLGCGTFWSGA